MKPELSYVDQLADRIRRGCIRMTKWSLALERVAQDGGVLMPRVLEPRRLHQLRAEVYKYSLRPAPERVGQVHQCAETASLSVERSPPAVRETAAWLATLLQGSGWRPNEVSIMAYPGSGAGITPHRDHSRYGRLIAILSIAGIAQFRIVADRAGRDVIESWECRPGDLVLLRAPGLADPVDSSDPRPLHAVQGPLAGRRISLTFRMDKGGTNSIPCYSP